MRTLVAMLRKDLTRDLRAPLGLVLTLGFPLVFALMLAVTFGGGGSSAGPKVELLVEDRDGGLAARALLSVFSAEQAAEFFAVTEVAEQGRAMIERGEASALLTIPEGFTEDLLKGTPVTLSLVRNPAEGILPEVAEQATRVLVEVLSSGSYALREPLDRLSAMLDAGQEPGDEAIADLSVLFRHTVERSSAMVLPPVITLESVDLEAPGDEAPGSASGGTLGFVFLMVLPGVSVFALFLLGDQVMRDILTEQQQGTLRRQLSAPLGAGRIVTGKVLHTAVVSTISLMVLALVAWAFVRRPVDAPAFVVLSLALILLVTGAASTIYGLARNERQGATMASVVYLALAFAGGSFFQADALPGALRALSPYTPFRWANDGFRSLIADGAGLGDVLAQIGLLAGVGVALLLVGSRLLQRRLLRGGAA